MSCGSASGYTMSTLGNVSQQLQNAVNGSLQLQGGNPVQSMQPFPNGLLTQSGGRRRRRTHKKRMNSKKKRGKSKRRRMNKKR